LALAALAMWTISYAALALLPGQISPQRIPALPSLLFTPLRQYAQHILSAIHTRVQIVTAATVAMGLLLIWVPLLGPRDKGRARLRPLRAAKGWILLLTAGSVLWIAYARFGAGTHVQAVQTHRDGEIDQAQLLYTRIVRFYPFQIMDFVSGARRGQRECALYTGAETAFRAGEWESAVRHYEALLLTNPALKLRDRAEAHLLDSLRQWARDLETSDQYERALDRYRYVRDEQLDRDRRGDGSDRSVHQAIGDLYVEWGDALLRRQDPEAALATYQRALADTQDPRVWAVAEERIIDAYCAWTALLFEQGRADRANGLCIELGNEFPTLPADRCTACAP
jgi:hypothetical protein